MVKQMEIMRRIQEQEEIIKKDQELYKIYKEMQKGWNFELEDIQDTPSNKDFEVVKNSLEKNK
jgi:hypothetical protein